jgi:cytochrome c oxidase assembly protein subunit 15
VADRANSGDDGKAASEWWVMTTASTAQPLAAQTPRSVGIWLLLIAALVAAMVMLGGATRLTQSGLSMTDWHPVTGILPPLGQAAWEAEFERYKLYPEYQKVNLGMSLAEFKMIFWFEYAHRVLGRLIGLAFLLPFLWYLLRRRLDAVLALKLGGVFLLGGLQGLVGWWMVKSGLVDHPDVSHYRLGTHLGLALLILAPLLWLGWRILLPAAPSDRPVPSSLSWLAAIVVVLVFAQALSGALVAGLDAGRHYNTFPMMNEAWFPDELWQAAPWWLNLFENPTTVQFDHRIGAYLTAALVLWLWISGRRAVSDRRTVRALDLMLAALVLQFGLGVLTLLYVVPVTLGVLHQGGALVLYAAALFALYRLPVA